jgi:hypothetical protein
LVIRVALINGGAMDRRRQGAPVPSSIQPESLGQLRFWMFSPVARHSHTFENMNA